LNLCDGAYDEDRAGEEVIHALENFNLPYTGSNARFYNYKKEYMKMVAHTSGINTPAHAFVYNTN
jgi:D-alanine-D-alanine ligase-like ATP-grasp enzyme